MLQKPPKFDFEAAVQPLGETHRIPLVGSESDWFEPVGFGSDRRSLKARW